MIHFSTNWQWRLHGIALVTWLPMSHLCCCRPIGHKDTLLVAQCVNWGFDKSKWFICLFWWHHRRNLLIINLQGLERMAEKKTDIDMTPLCHQSVWFCPHWNISLRTSYSTELLLSPHKLIVMLIMLRPWLFAQGRMCSPFESVGTQRRSDRPWLER